MTSLLITLPKHISWKDYEKELETVKDGEMQMNFKVSSRPKRVSAGDRCYICHNGYIVGWMKIVDIFYGDRFKCSTTGCDWDEGWYVARSGEFHYITPIPCKGFQGYRYIDSDNLE